MSFSQDSRSLCLSALAGALLPAPAIAQVQPEPDNSRAVEVVVITATKREERLQDVPIVVTAIGEQLLEDAGVRDVKDLQVLTPGLIVTSTSSEASTTARIRGVGTVGDNVGLESSVMVLVDGVYRPRNGVGFGDLGELQRVEVLKGPQGTLFGKNASAGVISVITKPPEFDFHAGTELTAGNYGEYGGSVFVNAPIVKDVLAGRLFAAKRQRDGLLDVAVGPGPRTEMEDNDRNYYTLRGQLLFEPNDNLKARLIVDYSDRDENCCAATQLFVGQAANSRANAINAVRPNSVDAVATPFDRKALANRSTAQQITDQGASLEVNWTLSDAATLTSITASRGWKAQLGQDADYTAADIVYRPADGSNNVGVEQFSEEVRIAGDAGKLSWLAGAFYAHEDVNSRSVLLEGADFYGYFAGRVLGGAPALIGLLPTGAALSSGTGFNDRYKQAGDSYAVFTENTFDVTDKLAVTLGLRWTRDEKDLRTRYATTGSSCDQAEAAFTTLVGRVGAATAQTIVGGLCLNQLNNDFDELGQVTQSRSEEAATGTLRIKYQVTPDAMAYFGYSRGFKSGGFNLEREQVIVTTSGLNFTADPDTSFKGEYVDAFEVGAKTSLFSNSLNLNAAVFHQTYADFQLNTFAGTAFIVETLPEVISKGVDADFVWRTPLQQVTLQGGLTYADTKISTFIAADLSNPARFSSVARLPGSTLSFAPKWSGSLSGLFEQPVGNGLMVRANVSAKFSSDYNTGSDLHPSKKQDAYTVVNARLGIGAANELWALELWGANILDEDYLQVGFNGPFQVDEANDAVSVYDAFLAPPATYGVTLRTRF